MMNDVSVFEHPMFGALRMVMHEGKPMFVGVDVARVLEYAYPAQAIGNHCKGIVKLAIPSAGGEQETNCIPEGDIYRLVTKAADQSRNPLIREKAERFERWVYDEVLPSLQKHGLYALDELIQNPDLAIKALEALKQERERTKALEAEIEQDKPFTGFGKAIAANSDAIMIGDFAKLICNSGINMGRTRLFNWLRENGFLMKGSTMPYQRYIDQGLFAVKESSITTIKGDLIKTTTLVTGKGQMVLLDMIQRTQEFQLSF